MVWLMQKRRIRLGVVKFEEKKSREGGDPVRWEGIRVVVKEEIKLL